MPAAMANPGEWGTAQHPLLFSPFGWSVIHDFLRARMKHVHTFDGREILCVKNELGDQLCLPLTLPDWHQACDQPRCDRPAAMLHADGQHWVCGEHA